MHTDKIVKIKDIYLDNNNPRHDPIDSEPEIIAHLLAKEGIKALARSISQLGSTSPLERLAVFPHSKIKDRYISAEGNRRICALKLLSDPAKAGSESGRKYFQSLADLMGNAPQEVGAVIFTSSATARPWVSLRHEGPQGGIGTKQWTSRQKARFNMQGQQSSNPNVQAALLMDYAQKHSLLKKEHYAKLSITTITRYLSNPVFRHIVGLADNRTLSVVVAKSEFDRVASKFLLDSVTEKSGVDSRTNARQREDYATMLRDTGYSPTSKNAPLDLAKQAIESLDEKIRKKRDNKNPNNRTKVIPINYSAHINDKILKRLYDELKCIDPDDCSFAAVYLLRGIIEQATSITLKKAGIAPPEELHSKLTKLADLLEEKGWSNRQIKVLRVMASEKNGRFSPDSIGHFVHGGMIPTRTDAIKLWDSLEHILTPLLNSAELSLARNPG